MCTRKLKKFSQRMRMLPEWPNTKKSQFNLSVSPTSENLKSKKHKIRLIIFVWNTVCRRDDYKESQNSFYYSTHQYSVLFTYKNLGWNFLHSNSNTLSTQKDIMTAALEGIHSQH
mmetsp:Transcript_5072/g.7005  ORF Transcript_5072/g.7005 Transcript_5072/m.7005 type:complete len:115 (-) Transcript_5072:79-423(-)